MMKRKTRIDRALAACASCLIAFSGCLHIATHPRGVTPNVRAMEHKPYEVVGESSGETSCFHLFWVLPVTASLDTNRAVEEAIIAKGGDNLIDVTWSVERQVWIVGTLTSVHIRGKVIRYRD
jgi:hypothetical protein